MVDTAYRSGVRADTRYAAASWVQIPYASLSPPTAPPTAPNPHLCRHGIRGHRRPAPFVLSAASRGSMARDSQPRWIGGSFGCTRPRDAMHATGPQAATALGDRFVAPAV